MTYTDEQINELAHRLWNRSVESGECILWLGASSGKGYGVISFNKVSNVYIHRLIYHLHHPEEVLDVVRHTCDTPNCWNIDHLINGSTAENVQDKVNKMRHVFGVHNHNARFTEDNIRYIRASDKNIYTLAGEFDVSPPTIHYIRSGKTWKHVK